jgi:hypothetical protein
MITPFRSRLYLVLQEQWDYISNFSLNIDRSLVSDGGVWKLNANKRFSTKSLYLLMENDITGSNNKWIWKAKLPLKINFFFGNFSRMLFLLWLI